MAVSKPMRSFGQRLRLGLGYRAVQRRRVDPHPIPEEPHLGEDIVAVEAEAEAEALQEAHAFAGAAVWAVPVALVHLAVIYLILSAVTGFKLPAFLRSDGLFAWLWINGAAVGLSIWAWKKGRVQIAPGQWMTGRRAKLAILAWLAFSFFWFVLPGLIGDLWRAVWSPLGDW